MVTRFERVVKSIERNMDYVERLHTRGAIGVKELSSFRKFFSSVRDWILQEELQKNNLEKAYDDIHIKFLELDKQRENFLIFALLVNMYRNNDAFSASDILDHIDGPFQVFLSEIIDEYKRLGKYEDILKSISLYIKQQDHDRRTNQPDQARLLGPCVSARQKPIIKTGRKFTLLERYRVSQSRVTREIIRHDTSRREVPGNNGTNTGGSNI